MGSRFDQIYRSILLTKFFTHGWGKPENLRRIFAFRKILSNRQSCMKLVDPNHPIIIKKEINNGDHILLEAEFLSPLVEHLPGLLPKESETACFQMLIPKTWKSHLRPTCLHLAGTGDHGYWRRRILMAKPLLQEAGIASILHENPFYGRRKPQNQLRSSLRNVSDLFLMGGCLVLESLAMFHWAEKQGFGPLGITGISMGGHMASLAASIWHKPITLIPCLSWSTASGVFTQGVLSGAINWELLKSQYFSDKVFRDELFNMIQSPEGYFRVYHEVGQHFARNFPESLDRVEMLKMHYDSESSPNVSRSPESHSSPSNVEPENQMSSSSISPLSRNFQVREVNNPLSFLENLAMFKSKANNRSVQKPLNLLRISKDKSRLSKPDALTPVVIRPVTAKNLRAVDFEPYINVKDLLTWEAIQFMRGIMDECTHLGNFSTPVDPALVIIVAAKDDGYMPRDGLIPLTELWPGSELRLINKGHITAFLFHQQVFRKAVKDGFQKLTDKYYSGPSTFDCIKGPGREVRLS